MKIIMIFIFNLELHAFPDSAMILLRFCYEHSAISYENDQATVSMKQQQFPALGFSQNAIVLVGALGISNRRLVRIRLKDIFKCLVIFSLSLHIITCFSISFLMQRKVNESMQRATVVRKQVPFYKETYRSQQQQKLKK